MPIEGVLIVVGQRVITGPDAGPDPFHVSVSNGGTVSFRVISKPGGTDIF